MNLSSLLFLFVFLPVILAMYFAFRRLGTRCGNWILLAASLLFYAWAEPKFVYALIGAALLNWLQSPICQQTVLMQSFSSGVIRNPAFKSTKYWNGARFETLNHHHQPQ